MKPPVVLAWAASTLGRDALPGEAEALQVVVERHAHDLAPTAEGHDLRHARHRGKLSPHREVRERTHGAGRHVIGGEPHQHDSAHDRRERAHGRRDVRGQLAGERGEALGDELAVDERLGVPAELDPHDREPHGRARAHTHGTPGVLFMAASMGRVVSRTSTSSGESPCASVRTVTVGRLRSGNTSTGRCTVVQRPTPSATSASARTRMRWRSAMRTIVFTAPRSAAPRKKAAPSTTIRAPGCRSPCTRARSPASAITATGTRSKRSGPVLSHTVGRPSMSTNAPRGTVARSWSGCWAGAGRARA